MKNSIRDTFATATALLAIFILASLTLLVVGCDEGMEMAKDVVGPAMEPEAEKTEEPVIAGDMKQPETDQPGNEQEDPEPTPTITIDGVTNEEDGSIMVVGSGTNLPKGTAVTVTMGDITVTTATKSKKGVWSVTVPAAEAETLPMAAVTITASAEGATSSFEYVPPVPPTITIENVTNEEDGSIMVTGTSTNLPAATVITITLGDVTMTATADEMGVWSTTVPAAEAERLPAGAMDVTAEADTAATVYRFRNVPPVDETALAAAEAERIQIEIINDVYKNYSGTFEQQKSSIISKYGGLFDMNTEIGRSTFRRFAEFHQTKLNLARSYHLTSEEKTKIAEQAFESAYGISFDRSTELVYEIYLDERPEDKALMNRLWQSHGIAMEYLLIRLDHPDATEEEWLELLRESVRAGNVSIVG